MRADNYECPVCGRKNVDAGSSRCPQCNSDLTCFDVLDSIPDTGPSPALREKSDSEIPPKTDNAGDDIVKTSGRIGGVLGNRSSEGGVRASSTTGFGPFVPGVLLSAAVLIVIMIFLICWKIMSIEESVRMRGEEISREIRSMSSEISELRNESRLLEKDIELRLLELRSEIGKSSDEISAEFKVAATDMARADSETAKSLHSMNLAVERLVQALAGLNELAARIDAGTRRKIREFSDEYRRDRLRSAEKLEELGNALSGIEGILEENGELGLEQERALGKRLDMIDDLSEKTRIRLDRLDRALDEMDARSRNGRLKNGKQNREFLEHLEKLDDRIDRLSEEIE